MHAYSAELEVTPSRESINNDDKAWSETVLISDSTKCLSEFSIRHFRFCIFGTEFVTYGVTLGSDEAGIDEHF